MNNFLICFLIFFSCNQKFVSKNSDQYDILIFGSGGGFTGVSSSYRLLTNGEVFRSGNMDDSWNQVGKLPKNITSQLFQNYTAMNFESISLNDPGNRYYFIERIHPNKKNHKIVWGHSALENKSLAIYHDIFMNHIKQLNLKNNPSK